MALKNKKHVFWQAFFLTILFFFLGLVLGVYLEQLRSDDSNIIFYQSETSLYDSFALSKLLDNSLISCDELADANVNFADKIYEEAKELERFDSSSKLTDSIKIIHRKYDLLRTLLWMNLIEVKEETSEKLLEIKKDLETLKYETEKIKSFLEMISEEFSKFAKKEDLEILAKQAKMFQPFKFKK